MKSPKTLSLLVFSICLFPFITWGQARLQFIHNSPDLSLDSIDVYVNKTLLLDNINFREASEFIQGPSGIPLLIEICPGNSTSAEDALYSTAVMLSQGKKYIAIAQGTIDGNGYNPWQPFELQFIDYARETSNNTGQTDVLFFHGSTDAPALDIIETTSLGLLCDNLSYGQFDGYKELTPANYVLEIKDSASQTRYFNLQFDLTTYSGQALILMASGFLVPGMNNNGEDLGFYIVPASGGMGVPLPPKPDPMAYIQFIHLCADQALDSMDIWIGNKKIGNALPFRYSLPFSEILAEQSHVIAIQPAGSISPDNPLASLTYTFHDQQKYLLMITGIISETGYTPSPALQIYTFDSARTEANPATTTDLLAFHGSTDAPNFDIYETGVGLGLLVEDLAYGNFASEGYLSLTTADYVLEVRNKPGNEVLYSYSLPLSALGLQGKALSLCASGFVNPGNNSNGPGFGLFLALPDGGPLFELPTYIPPTTAFIQFIHNIADTSAQYLDIWMDNQLLLDNHPFHRASAYIEVLANQNLTFSVLHKTSTSPSNPLASLTQSLESGKHYIVVLDGIASSSGYNPLTAVSMNLFENARLIALDNTKVDVLFHHGSTDASEFSIYDFSMNNLFEGLSYSMFSPYIEVNSIDQGWHLISENEVIKSYQVPLNTLQFTAKAVIALASGFYHPENNSNGQAFGLYLIPAEGGAFISLQDVTGTSEIQDETNFSIYPNPARDFIEVNANHFQGFIRLEIYSIEGKKMLSKDWNTIETSKVKIDIKDWPIGIYLIRLSTEDGVMTKKLQIIE